MSVYKSILIFSFIASDLFTFNALAFNKQISKLYQSLSLENDINKNDLHIQSINIIGISSFRDVLIEDNIDIDIKLSNIVSEEVDESQSDERLSVDIISDINYEENGIFYAEGNVVLTMQNGILYTDKLSYDRANKIIVAEGNINFSKGNQFFEASMLQYDFSEDKGFVKDIYGVMDFDKIDKDLNLDIAVDEKDLCEIENIDLINLPTEVSLLNSGNVRFSNKFSLDSFEFNFSEVTNWRFKSERIDINSDEFSSEYITFTNDPYNDPQFLVISKGFKGEIIEGRRRFKSNSTFLNFDNKITIPIGRRTIDDKEGSIWGIGYETKDKDGLFLSRSFDPLLINSSLEVDLKPYFLLQRAFTGKTNAFRQIDSSVTSDNIENNVTLSDLFALDINIKKNILNSENKNEAYLSINSSFKSLNPDRLYDSFSLNASFLKNLYSETIIDNKVFEESCDIDVNKSETFKSYKSDLGIYAVFDKDDIYTAYGGKIINNFYSSTNQLSKDYSLIFDVGSFEGTSVLDSKQLVADDRFSFSSSFTHNYKVLSNDSNDSEYNQDFKYTPNILENGIFLTANISYGLNYYSSSNSQSIIQAGIGTVFIYGDLKDRFFDYTFISLMPEYTYKRGQSTFSFDDFNNDSRLIINLKQQLYGPILIGFDANLNLNNSSEDYGILQNRQFSIGVSRRAYAVDFIYDVDEEYVLLNFNINNFDYENYSNSF